MSVSGCPDYREGLGTYINMYGEKLIVSGCTDHQEDLGTYRVMYGEKLEHAADNETMCFKLAKQQWRHCGMHDDEQSAAIYGPSGNYVIRFIRKNFRTF